VAQAGAHPLTGELSPSNSFHSPSHCFVQLGLGEREQVDELTIRWPSGLIETLQGIWADRHLLIEKNRNEVKSVVRGESEILSSASGALAIIIQVRGWFVKHQKVV